MTTYNYTKTPCTIDSLTQEIQTSAIVTTLSSIQLFGSALDITFVSSLSVGDKTLLDTIVTNHLGLGLDLEFIEVSASSSTSTNSSSYVLLNSMSSPYLLAGDYMIIFTGTFNSNAPLLSHPGLYVSAFVNGVQIPVSETSYASSSVGLFPLTPIGVSFNCKVTVGLNQKIEVKWKNNNEGNTITATNRVLDIMRLS